ncbi:MAG: hypothetical protein PWQ28_522 [Candidatus Woesearchaeota archaeon]|nr:hypothetical protein [Candidatus Woesearchaeota archaeon]
MNIEKLRSDLINIYKTYLSDPENEENKSLAGRIYNKYKDLDPLLTPEIAIAMSNLVDIGFNTGVKTSQDEIKEIIKKLENGVPK